jgi:hypothetical protein
MSRLSAQSCATKSVRSDGFAAPALGFNQQSVNTGLFPPPKRAGLIFHGASLLALVTATVWSTWELSVETGGPTFVAYLLLALLSFAPIPLLAYRGYALLRAQYRLDRDTLEMRWGLRDEVVPLGDIEWIRSTTDLVKPIGLPPLPLPGAILGMRRHPDMGIVEFMASSPQHLVLVATAARVFCISPEQPAAFIDTFGRAIELGSLKDAHARSQFPSFVIAEAWRSGIVRYLWLAGLFLNIGLIAWSSALIPSGASIALGFGPGGSPNPAPVVRIVILPLASALMSLGAWGAGLYFFRLPRRRPLAIAVWAWAALSSLLFLLGLLFVVTTPV